MRTVMRDVRQVVCEWAEEVIDKIFDVVEVKDKIPGVSPDRISRDGSFFLEVKTSSYTNGGVINERQMNRYSEVAKPRRFYAFVYHAITRDMRRDHPTERRLVKALKPRSVYLLPFSVVYAHFNNSKQIRTPYHDTFVQLKESTARNIGAKDVDEWRRLRLLSEQYKVSTPHDRVLVMTKQGDLEDKILGSIKYDQMNLLFK